MKKFNKKGFLYYIFINFSYFVNLLVESSNRFNMCLHFDLVTNNIDKQLDFIIENNFFPNNK